jgi:hypothetical protein
MTYFGPSSPSVARKTQNSAGIHPSDTAKVGIPPRSASVSEASTDDDELFMQLNPSKPRTEIVDRFLDLVEIEKSSATVRIVQKLVRMLLTCKYTHEDINAVLALGASHHKVFMSSIQKTTSLTERLFILIAQIYIAHCIIMDECCCIANWHRYLFSTYCDLRALNCAISRILKRMDWNLGVDHAEIESYINRLNTGIEVTGLC